MTLFEQTFIRKNNASDAASCFDCLKTTIILQPNEKIQMQQQCRKTGKPDYALFKDFNNEHLSVVSNVSLQ